MIGLTQHQRDLRLIGGGHSHIITIRQLAMKPLAGVRVTLISSDTMTPYSGMMPGLIAGHYTFGECYIDLRKLCQWAGVQFIRSEVMHIDTANQRIDCLDHPALRYDILSLDIGSAPALKEISGAEQYGFPVKPVKQFLQHWQHWLEVQRKSKRSPHIVVVGGGGAGIEILLALHHRLLTTPSIRAEFTLVNAESSMLHSHNARVQSYFQRHLQSLGIQVISGKRVIAVDSQRLTLADQTTIDYDFLAWTIHAGAQPWLAKSGLACDDRGFVQVDQYLRSRTNPNIFAAGDCITFMPNPLPKAGVHAVRQGSVLAKNIAACLEGGPLQPYKPQRLFLSLLTTGDRYAVASRGAFFARGKWVWHWKDFIDRRFMQRFIPKPMRVAQPDGEASDTMRCGGCGAKIGSTILHNVLAQLPIKMHADVVSGLGDDAAIIDMPVNTRWLQSVDFFRSFIDDPYLLGRIAAVHSLSDIYAMGGTPHSALVIAVIPYAHDAIMQEQLLHLMKGVMATLDQENTALIGGHSGEGPEMAVGLTVNGRLLAGQAFTKSGLKPGDRLILTKPIGSGVLLAANMAAQCYGPWLDHAMTVMLQSNAAAAMILRSFAVTGCTDITGFGLLGHLQEMLSASRCSAVLSLDAIPVMDGAQQCSAQGIRSSLYPKNQVMSRYCRFDDGDGTRTP